MSQQGFAFSFGRYKGKQVSDIVDSDPSYCTWVLHQPDQEEKNNDLFNFLIQHGVEYDDDYNKKKQQSEDKKKTHFGFGKYKNLPIEDVFTDDRQYCEHVIKLVNVVKYQSKTVKTINDLIKSST
tara:strand:+ start:508 stop:882 length:375 start_codon:yes stop_codon:yes gene_type:complete